MAVTQGFAQGKRAYGFCDRCGFRYDLPELKYEIWDRFRRNLRVCPSCWDPDHPQLRLGDHPFSDPQTLRDPRPDNAKAGSQQLFSWKPVGNTINMQTSAKVGRVTVTTS
jgi:hypothetical protein